MKYYKLTQFIITTKITIYRQFWIFIFLEGLYLMSSNDTDDEYDEIGDE